MGGHRTVKVDVRVVAATHRDLGAAVQDGGFREDLFYRLNVLPIRVPPLRERLADILPLGEHFLRRAAARRATGRPRRCRPRPRNACCATPWPGNVRELRNLMERCHVLVRHRVIDVDDLGLDTAVAPPSRAPSDADLPAAWLDGELPAAVERLERLLIAMPWRRRRATAPRRPGGSASTGNCSTRRWRSTVWTEAAK